MTTPTTTIVPTPVDVPYVVIATVGAACTATVLIILFVIGIASYCSDARKKRIKKNESVTTEVSDTVTVCVSLVCIPDIV